MARIASTSFTFHVTRLELKEVNIADNTKSKLPLFILSFMFKIIEMILYERLRTFLFWPKPLHISPYKQQCHR